MRFEQEFFNYAASVGVNFVDREIKRAGEIVRADTEGSRRNSKTGWYVWHDEQQPFCIFGDWKSYGDKRFMWSVASQDEMTKKEIRQMKQKAKAAAKANAEAKEKRQKEAADDCLIQMDIGETAIYHPYADRKGFGAMELKINHLYIEKDGKEIKKEGLLSIPMYNEDGEIRNIQYIDENGFKMFHPNAQVLGCFHPMVKGTDNKTVIICEGYATGRALEITTNADVVVAFSTSNLKAIGVIMMSYYDRIVFAADDDWMTEKPIKNPGFYWANQAADVCRGEVITPPFNNSVRGRKDTDFDDFARLHGNKELKAFLRELNL